MKKFFVTLFGILVLPLVLLDFTIEIIKDELL